MGIIRYAGFAALEGTGEAGEAQDPQFAACVRRGRTEEILGLQGAESGSLEYFEAAEEPPFAACALELRTTSSTSSTLQHVQRPSHFSEG